MIAAYNGGESGIENAVVDTLNNSNGKTVTWADIAHTLEQGKGIYALPQKSLFSLTKGILKANCYLIDSKARSSQAT